MQAKIIVDKNCSDKKKVPSDRIYAKGHSHKCTQQLVTPANPASPGHDQICSVVSYGGSPFESCFYSDSDCQWELYYKDSDDKEVSVGIIKFHETNSCSWHNNGSAPVAPYDIMIQTVSDIDRNSKFEVHIRPSNV
jgi:hypothetical protein